MKRQWSPQELQESWALAPSELLLLLNMHRKNKLGYALLLKFFQQEGCFPESKNEVPKACAAFVAEQIEIPVEEFFEFFKYDWDDRNSRNHRSEIRELCGFREFSNDDTKQITAWLVENCILLGVDDKQAGLALYARFKELKIEPPERSRVERLIRSARKKHEKQVFEDITNNIPKRVRKRLDALLSATEDDDPAEQPLTITDLREEPRGVNLKSILREVKKLECIRDVGLPDKLFEHLSPKLVELYKRRAATEKMPELRRHPDYIRYPLLAAFCHIRAQELNDTLTELLLQIVSKIHKSAEAKVIKEFVADLKRVQGKTNLLYRLAEAAIANPDGTVREVIFSVAGEQTLRDLVNEFKHSGPYYRQQVTALASASYNHHYHRMVPKVLNALDFRSNNEQHRPVMAALKIIKSKDKLTAADLKKLPIEGVIKPSDRELVLTSGADGKSTVDQVAYKLHFLQTLKDTVRSKEVWVSGANRYRNPDEDLPSDFQSNRHDYYKALKLPIKADTFIRHLQLDMRQSLSELDSNILKNDKVKILERGKIVVTPLTAQKKPPNLQALGDELEDRWSMTSALDLLKETDLRLGLTKQFHSVATRETMSRETIQRRLLLCLHGLGTNTGLKRGNGGEKTDDLRYILRRFVTKEALRDAIRNVVNGVFKVRQAHIWGEGTTSCAADSKQFGAWDQNLMTEWHMRYGGRGVMIYWHVERKSTCIYSQLKTVSSSEVAAMVQGVLRHCTDMSVDKAYVDSHGQSEVGFAFCHLLGFDLMPRLKGIDKQKLNRPEAGNPGAFPNLQPILTRPIDWDLIRQQYDEMVKFATAIKIGTADAESILRRFTKNNPMHPTYQAFTELGRVIKTMFLCRYLKSEEVRREIHEGLNVVESWNSVNGFIFFGKHSEFASNKLEDHELSVLCLHLLQVCMVYINTLMLQEVLAEKAWTERMTPEDYRGLSPLVRAHINPYGVFALDMDKRLALKAA
jgi:TnpA family transposase